MWVYTFLWGRILDNYSLQLVQRGLHFSYVGRESVGQVNKTKSMTHWNIPIPVFGDDDLNFSPHLFKKNFVIVGLCFQVFAFSNFGIWPVEKVLNLS